MQYLSILHVYCKINETVNIDSEWHLIFGGSSPFIEGDLDSVELFNWQNGSQCQLPPLPFRIAGQAAIAMDGTIAFCGGENVHYQESLLCYKLEKNTRNWTQVNKV